MTCIVAQKTETGVLMAADNSCVDGSRLIRRGTPKLANVDARLVVGVAGRSRIGELALNSNAWPEREALPAGEYLQKLAAFFRELLKNEDRDAPFWALVASDRDIYCVGPNGCVVLVDSDYCAQGSAELVALGALFVLSHVAHTVPLEPRTKLTLALNAAAEHVEGIRPPWIFAETRTPETTNRAPTSQEATPERTAPSRPFNPMVGRVLG